MVDTTVGRALLSTLLPTGLSFDLVNRDLTKKAIDALKEINLDRQDPLGTAKNIRMVYTDSIKIQAILTAPMHIDYTNLDFKYA